MIMLRGKDKIWRSRLLAWHLSPEVSGVKRQDDGRTGGLELADSGEPCMSLGDTVCWPWFYHRDQVSSK